MKLTSNWRRLCGLLAATPILLSSGPALSCAVCFGDPDAAMTQGAQAGILVLLGVIGTVLIGIAGMAFFWVRRARALDAGGLTHARPLADQALPPIA